MYGSPQRFISTLQSSAGFLVFALRVIQKQTIRSARQLFLASIIYLPLLLATIVVDRLI